MIEAADRRVSGEVILGAPQGGRQYAQAMLVVDSDDPDTIVKQLQPIADIAPLLDHSIGLTTYDQVMESTLSEAPQQGQGEPQSHSGLARHLTPAFAKMPPRARLAPPTSSRSAPSAERIRHTRRCDRLRVAGRELLGRGPAPGSTKLDTWWEKLSRTWRACTTASSPGWAPRCSARVFPPEHLVKLRALKRRYDPTGLFRDNFFIDPGAADGA